MHLDPLSVIMSDTMARTSTYHAYDRLLGGSLGRLLLAAKADGKSVEDIVYELRRHHDIKISTATVYRWLSIAEADAAEAAS